MDTEDIRWQQRFENFRKAFSNLQRGVQLSEVKKLNEFVIVRDLFSILSVWDKLFLPGPDPAWLCQSDYYCI